MRGCEFVRAGDAAEGLCLTSAELPPGTRLRCHLHRGIDSAGFIARGTVRTWWGEQLEHEQVLTAGDEPAFIVVAHSSASDQDGIELLPALDALLDERGA